jgi:hypothetical protein
MTKTKCETCKFDPMASNDFASCPIWKLLQEKYSDEFRDYKLELLGSFRVTTQYTGCKFSKKRTPPLVSGAVVDGGK